MSATPSSPTPSKAKVFALRTTSTVSLWALVTFVFLAGKSWAFCGLISLLALVALKEYLGMVRRSGSDAFPALSLCTAAIWCAARSFFLIMGNPAPAIIDPAALFVITTGAFTLQLRHPVNGKETLNAVALAVLGFVMIPFLFLFCLRIVFLEPAVDGKVAESGAFLLLWLLAVTKFTDMGAYITGSLCGKHKMIPHISPGKTWEGFVGAIIFSQLAACGLFALFPRQLAALGGYHHAIALGFILALLAVVGDLAESVVKRALGAKDSGRFLPGIGGALDLIDSICFTAPAMFFYLQWIQPA